MGKGGCIQIDMAILFTVKCISRDVSECLLKKLKLLPEM